MPERPTSSGRVLRWHWDEPLAVLRQVLAAGGILGIPTESSYALAVDPGNPAAVEAVYEIKARERGKPLLVVVADVAQATALGVAPDLPQLELLAELWPAPLTAVLPLARPVAAAAGASTLAVRVPAHAGLRRLLAALGSPLTATSANRSGEAPVVDPEDLDQLLAAGPAPAVVVDGGVLPGGPPSTLVAWRDGELRILRRGAFEVAGLQHRQTQHMHRPGAATE